METFASRGSPSTGAALGYLAFAPGRSCGFPAKTSTLLPLGFLPLPWSGGAPPWTCFSSASDRTRSSVSFRSSVFFSICVSFHCCGLGWRVAAPRCGLERTKAHPHHRRPRRAGGPTDGGRNYHWGPLCCVYF